MLFAEGNCMNSKTAFQVSGICFKTLPGKVQDWNPKTVLKRSNFFLLKAHGEPHMKSLHHKNIHFLRLNNISKHTTDTSFTLVSLYFSRSDVLKQYTVLESFTIYKLNLTFQQCKSFHISGLSRL